MKGKELPVLIAGAIAALTAAGIGAGIYFYNSAISTTSSRETPGNPEGNDDFPFYHDQKYFDENEREDVYMQSRDGLLLHGTAVIKDEKKWTILVHGYTSNAMHMSSFAALFGELGFSVLAVDLRGHGESEGNYRGMGWHDSYDVCDWASLITERYGAEDVILFGLSMGAATVMLASGHDLPDSVKGIIEDCGYSSVKAEMKYNMKVRYHLPGFPLLNIVSGVTKKRAGYSLLTDGDAVAQLKKTTIPMLFIHGEADRFVPFSMMEKVYRAAGGEKMKFTVPGAAHAMCFNDDPEGYRDAVYSFIYKYVRI